MSTVSLRLAARDRGDIATILAAGAALGVLDAIFAVVVYVVVLRVITVTQLFQGIAAALLGRASFHGGAATAVLGVLMHFSVALAWSAIFLGAYRLSARLRRAVAAPGGALAIGAAYGSIVWLGMQLVVVPLTRNRPASIHSPMFLVMLAGHMVIVGQPIVWVVRRRAGR